MRKLSFAKAILEATDQCMDRDPDIYIIGLGVPDPGAIFGTTEGLREKYGSERVMDMPVAENGMTGIALGSALAGMRPVLVHQRADFALLSMDQIVNQAAKWQYTFNGQARIPLVIRIIIGRGWGQGPQHSQSLHAWLGHIPGLKVVMPFSPADAKGLMIAAIEDDNPVILLEHRWLHTLQDHVDEALYRTPIGKAKVIRNGSDVTLVGISHSSYECLRAADILERYGVSALVVDLRTVRPLDKELITDCAARTGRVVVADSDWACCGLSAEILALITENAFDALKAAPLRVTWPDHPLPTSPALSEHFYPDPEKIAVAALHTLKRPIPPELVVVQRDVPHDVPDLSFTGPF